MSAKPKVLGILGLALLAGLLAIACDMDAASEPDAVIVSPENPRVRAGSTQQFSAAITGRSNFSGVEWTLHGLPWNSRTSINTSGLLVVDGNETATSFTVRATSSRTDAEGRRHSINGTATVVVEIPTVTSVEVRPGGEAVVDVPRGGEERFTALVTGGMIEPPQEVNWTVTGRGWNSQTTINTAGFLSVDPGESATFLTVQATSRHNTRVSGTATVRVTAP